MPLCWGGYDGLIITHRLKNDDSEVWGSSSIFSPLIYFSFTEKKNTKAHMKRTFVKVKDKVKKWLSLDTSMFKLENNSGLMYMNVDCLPVCVVFPITVKFILNPSPPDTFGPILIRGWGCLKRGGISIQLQKFLPDF